jgi:hypothetical protein
LNRRFRTVAGTFDQYQQAARAITPLPIKSVSDGLLASISVTEACG